MGSFSDKLLNVILKLSLFGYLVMAFLVGNAKSPNGHSAILAILEGALWPITLIVAWIRQG